MRDAIKGEGTPEEAREVIAYKDAAEILRQVIAEYMPKEDENIAPE